ncbi:MAG: hypothetical protein HUJ56_10780 [Erysipelotrichaceae bacterium]|nr:hypothetical protein [Erysipelotrichaceae bacterium]
MLKKQIEMIHDTVNAEGANLADDSVIKQIIDIRPDLDEKYNIVNTLRYNAWTNSVTAGRYLKEWNDNLSTIVK